MLTLSHPYSRVRSFNNNQNQNKMNSRELQSIIQDLSAKVKEETSYIHMLRRYQSSINSTYQLNEQEIFQKKFDFAQNIITLLKNEFEKELYKARLSLLKKPLQ